MTLDSCSSNTSIFIALKYLEKKKNGQTNLPGIKVDHPSSEWPTVANKCSTGQACSRIFHKGISRAFAMRLVFLAKWVDWASGSGGALAWRPRLLHAAWVWNTTRAGGSSPPGPGIARQDQGAQRLDRWSGSWEWSLWVDLATSLSTIVFLRLRGCQATQINMALC